MSQRSQQQSQPHTSCFSSFSNFSGPALSTDQDDSKPYMTVTSTDFEETPPIGDNPHPSYVSRIQSRRLHDDDSVIPSPELIQILASDLRNRVIQVSNYIVDALFPDEAFGFPITASFLRNFDSAFLAKDGCIDASNFSNEATTSMFLNRMITTIALFLQSTGQSILQPLRYFSSLQSQKPLEGRSPLKPDIVLIRLIDGCIQKETTKLAWVDIQAFIEHTREKKPPMRMPETVTLKSYQMFCTQPERDFVISLCITGEGFHIVVTTRSGQLETDVIEFGPNASISFVRMVMGFAFLSDDMIGVDASIIRRGNLAKSSGIKLQSRFPPFLGASHFVSKSLAFTSDILPPTLAITYTPAPEGFDRDYSHITINGHDYKVIRLLFRAQTLIGRASRIFLVLLPDGNRGILKDIWAVDGRLTESGFLEGLEIPFGPRLVTACRLRSTSFLQQCIVMPGPTTIDECRVKQRLVTTPAGVHISDFSCLWELMVALLDIVIAIMYLETQNKLHRDISYTNVLLQEPGVSRNENQIAWMNKLGLSQIQELREELKCREGLLIDYDYGAPLEMDTNASADPAQLPGEVATEEKTENQKGKGSITNHTPPKVSGSRTGTAPFISMELLIFGVPHRVAHDLESIVYVLLFIASHLDGPANSVRNPPLYGGGPDNKHPSFMKQWLGSSKVTTLGNTKLSHMVVFFESHILEHISPYFKPISPYIAELWHTILPDRKTKPTVGIKAIHSTATCMDIINIFKKALLNPSLIEEAKASKSVLGKRARPGDLVIALNGWDVDTLSKKHLTKPVQLRSKSRTTKLMTKGRK